MASKPSPHSHRDPAFAQAIARAGGQIALGKLIGLTQAAVSKRFTKGLPIWLEHVLAVEAATGISRHVLRPDVFGDVRQTPPNSAIVPIALGVDLKARPFQTRPMDNATISTVIDFGPMRPGAPKPQVSHGC